MRSKWVLAVIAGLAALAVTAANVSATPGSGFTAVQQWKGVFDDIDVMAKADRYRLKLNTRGTSDTWVTRNAIDPGGQSGWHTHPGPSLIIVTLGEVTAYDGHDPTCTGTVYTAGEGFIDEGSGHVHLLRNETDQPAETVAVQILPKDATRRIDSPDPGRCPF
jgi:quercetin dioxygenase-like cupin family protein